MGYESKIYIVNKTNVCYEDVGKKFSMKIAEFKLGKLGELGRDLSECPEADCFLYMDDGNTPILEDKYGEPLTEISPYELIKKLYTTIGTGDKYERRNAYKLLFPLLNYLKMLPENENIVCLHYGY